jgi:hypothetical protein
VVSMHEIAMSSSVNGNGSDLGVRQEWLPLFDRYDVDLVLGGHDHDYERSYTVRGVEPGSSTLSPQVVDMATKTIDVTKGAVHLVLGGGGSVPTDTYEPSTPPPASKVIVGKTARFVSVYDYELPTWSAVRDPAEAYGFGVFDVVPSAPGGKTQIRARYYQTASAPGGPPVLYDTFTLEKPRAT